MRSLTRLAVLNRENLLERLDAVMRAADPQPGGMRRALDSEDPDALVAEFVARFEDLRQRSAELEQSNDQLQAALKENTEKLVRAEQSLMAVSRLGRFAATSAAQMLGRALEEVESGRTAVDTELAARRDATRKRALTLQTEVLAYLEEAQDEAALVIAKSEGQALETLRKTRESILALSGGLDQMIPGPTGDETARQGPVAGVSSSREAVSAELLAGPFDNIAALGKFVKELRRARGIASVEPEGFSNGTLRLAVDFNGGIPLSDALVSLRGFSTRVEPAGLGKIKVEILSNGGLSAPQ